MSAAEALKAALAAGVSVEIDGDDLVLEASAPPPPAVLDLLSQHKAPIIAMLRWQNRRGKFGSKESICTTARAIGEADSGCRPAVRSFTEAGHSPAMAADLRHRIATAMGRLPSPRGCRLMAETRTFLRSAWFSEALKYGWSLEELFGVDACLPLDNLDHWGLIVGLALAPKGGDVIEHLNAKHAIIRYRIREPFKEARRIERRFMPADTSVVWWECLALVGDH